jgi:hypothetical protein
MTKKSDDSIWEEGVHVFTKAGQIGNRFRYYVLFTSINDKKFVKHDKEIIEYIIKEVDKEYKSKAESISFGDETYVHIHWLIPDNVAPQSVYDKFLDVVSSKFNIVSYHVNSSNIDDFTKQDIVEYKKFLKNTKNERDD